jgi:polygalacturonase
MIATRYDGLGPERVEPLFHGDHTHTSLEGADLNAASVVAAINALPANPLAPFLLQNRISANQYGVKADGRTVDTAAIQAAIDAAAKVGGTVVFSPGTYLTGSLFLKSGVHFRVDAGAEIRGVPDISAYPLLPTRVAGIEMKWPAALINVYEQSDVEISGAGTVDGDGKIWWDKYWALRAEYDPKGLRWAADYDCQRPRLIQIYKSTNVQLRGLTLKRSGFWTVHICYSTKVTVDGITIRNNIGGRGPSTDGIDIDSSSEVLVQNADIECNDDAVVLKAGRDADGLRVNRPTENVIVRNVTVRSGAAGITFGSETSGGIRHVEASGIHVSGAVPTGILFKSAQTRGGTIEDIAIHDLDIGGVKAVFSVEFNWNPNYSYARIPADVSNVPDYWRALATPVPREKGLPHLRNVRVSDLRATDSRQAFSVASYADSPIENVTFANLDIQADRGGTIRNADGWRFVSSRIQTADGRGVTVEESREITGLDGYRVAK